MTQTTFEFQNLELPGAKLIRVPKFEDARGYFSVTMNSEDMEAAGVTRNFVQDNQSMSADKGTVRGLHYQLPPFAQGKLVRVLRGRIMDVIVDARTDSPTFGLHQTVELSESNGLQLFVPRGFLHGLMTLEANTIVLYKVDNAYAPGLDRSIQWDDPDLGIEWPSFEGGVTLSEKDKNAARWSEMDSPFLFDDPENGSTPQ